jgi:hypothetical protein
MKMTVLLARDHGALRDRFDDFVNAEPDGRRAAFSRLREAFELHAQLEEELLYPELLKLPTLRGRTREAEQEHRIIRQRCAEIAALNSFDASSLARVEALRELVEQHVDDEEEQIFVRARELLGEERLAELGQRFEKRRDTLLRARTPVLA